MSLFSFSRFFNSTTKLYKSFETKLSARLRRLEESICRYIDRGGSVEKAVDGALEKERFFDAVTKEITSGVARAAVNGHNVLPQKQPDTTREEEKLLEAMQDEKPVRISSQLQRRLSKKLADTPWNADDMKLSERLHSGRVRSEIIDTVRSGLRNADTIGQLGRKLYDGYGNGGVLSEADMPKYLKKLINCAKLALGENAGKKAELLALAKSLKANTDKLQTKDLKIAYQNLLAVCTSPELKKEALQQAIYTAVQEKTRYHAMRIARSEFQRAWFQGLLARYEDNELLFGWQWNLSSRHKYVRFDQCDVIANADMGYGKGIYPKSKVPFIPRHPHCGCTVVPVFEMQVNTKKRFRPEKARNYIDSLEDWKKQVLFGKDGMRAYESGTDWQKLLRGWDGFGKAKPILEKSDFDPDDISYMSSNFRPEYDNKKQVIQFNNVSFQLKRVNNSQFSLYADIDMTRRNKAVRLAEKILRTIKHILPDDFKLPNIAVIDFDKYNLKASAIGGFDKSSGYMFINSKYNTKKNNKVCK